jgi:FixJ family two-component response regulator
MSGLDLQQHLAASGRRIPIIIMTANADRDAQIGERALGAGAIALLRKPFNDEDLLRAVRAAALPPLCVGAAALQPPAGI